MATCTHNNDDSALRLNSQTNDTGAAEDDGDWSLNRVLARRKKKPSSSYSMSSNSSKARLFGEEEAGNEFNEDDFRFEYKIEWKVFFSSSPCTSSSDQRSPQQQQEEIETELVTTWEERSWLLDEGYGNEILAFDSSKKPFTEKNPESLERRSNRRRAAKRRMMRDSFLWWLFDDEDDDEFGVGNDENFLSATAGSEDPYEDEETVRRRSRKKRMSDYINHMDDFLRANSGTTSASSSAPGGTNLFDVISQITFPGTPGKIEDLVLRDLSAGRDQQKEVGRDDDDDKTMLSYSPSSPLLHPVTSQYEKLVAQEAQRQAKGGWKLKYRPTIDHAAWYHDSPKFIDHSEDVMSQILSYLPLSDALTKVRLVSHRWKMLFDSCAHSRLIAARFALCLRDWFLGGNLWPVQIIPLDGGCRETAREDFLTTWQEDLKQSTATGKNGSITEILPLAHGTSRGHVSISKEGLYPAGSVPGEAREEQAGNRGEKENGDEDDETTTTKRDPIKANKPATYDENSSVCPKEKDIDKRASDGQKPIYTYVSPGPASVMARDSCGHYYSLGEPKPGDIVYFCLGRAPTQESGDSIRSHLRFVEFVGGPPPNQQPWHPELDDNPSSLSLDTQWEREHWRRSEYYHFDRKLIFPLFAVRVRPLHPSSSQLSISAKPLLSASTSTPYQREQTKLTLGLPAPEFLPWSGGNFKKIRSRDDSKDCCLLTSREKQFLSKNVQRWGGDVK